MSRCAGVRGRGGCVPSRHTLSHMETTGAPATKTCSACDTDKAYTEFHLDRAKRDGRCSRCKQCTANRRAYKREYMRANPHKSWESTYRRRSRLFGFMPVVVTFTRGELTSLYGNDCFHCGGPFEELDHYPVPVISGGVHALANCRPSCKSCNRDSWHMPAVIQAA